MNKNHFLIASLIILVIIFIIHYIQYTTQVFMEFHYGRCDSEISPYNQSSLGIREIKWTNNTTLQVKAYVSINCAEEIQYGNYTIVNNKIILTYASSSCTVCTSCLCAHELIYSFSGLQKKDYEFELKRIRGSEIKE